MLVQARCTGCSANIEVDNGQTTGTCRFCGTTFIIQNSIDNFNNQNGFNQNQNGFNNQGFNNGFGGNNGFNNNNGFNQNQNNFNNQGFNNQQQNFRNAPPRPRLNGCLAAFLLVFYVVPGIIYVVYINHKQSEWDKMYGGRNF